MNSSDTCLDALKSLDSLSLRFRPKTSEPIEIGRFVSASFEHASKSERGRLLAAVQPALAMKLLGLSGFMAEAAVNSRDESLIRSAILLHVIEDFRSDYRENYRYLVLIAHASKLLGVDLKSIVASIEGVASERAGKCLGDFVSRDDSLNRLDSFGIKAEIDGGVFRFVSL